jgi:PAS domain S-box-containing protein
MKKIIFILFLTVIVYSNELKLDKKEKEYIDKSMISVTTTASWAPLNYNDKEKNIIGLGLDYWDLVVKKIGLNYKIVVAKNFQDVLESIKVKKNDITLTTTKTKQRKEYANFTLNYDSFPVAIATTKDKKFIAKASLLNGKKVAVGREYSAYYLLKKRYPKIDYIQVENTKEALNLVQNKKVFAAIDILPTLQFNVNNHQSNDLKIAGTTDVNFDLCFMVRDDYEELIPILNKAINSISDEERNDIYKKWLFKATVPVVDYTMIYQLIVVFILITFIIIYWNRKLKKEKDKLNYILTHIPVPIIITNNETRKIMFANPYASELYKFDKKELIGSSIDIIYTDLENQKDEILSAMDENGIVIDFESKYKLKNEEIIDALLSIIPIEYNRQDSRVGVIANVTELKNIQKELIELNKTLEVRVGDEIEKNKEKAKQLFQQSRLAQMGEMISMIAHQWRQPLSAISSTSNTINLKSKLNNLDKETAIELSNKITKYSGHLSQTIDDFREFFKPNKDKEETTFDLVVESVLNIIDSTLKVNKIDIELKLDSKIVFNTYPNEIKQVLLNLIKNAEDVLIEREIENPKIVIQTQESRLSVYDNAGGIPTDIIDNIFDPYFSTKLKKDGTGLGLYMSKMIIEDHCKGNLEVSNNKYGALFTIELGEQNG